ncbi:hypothetical protein CERSUDRAFT_80730 [Gelatoporia subvermispora B]|uniref:Uncharacterized protein n=1 Tax=Ceriporiopsis subvermispora (strain B) TaxID=914234 RepID=M2RRM0_CERS8|nr:hypothetical protein CERSUDRAFT_80730 [Gelatoporia subvermispora B]
MDLSQKLDRVVVRVQDQEAATTVAFLYVLREFKTTADSLAKLAAVNRRHMLDILPRFNYRAAVFCTRLVTRMSEVGRFAPAPAGKCYH